MTTNYKDWKTNDPIQRGYKMSKLKLRYPNALTYELPLNTANNDDASIVIIINYSIYISN